MRQGNSYLTDEQWRLVEENMGLIGYIVMGMLKRNPNYYSNYTYWYDEFFSEGKVGLINAAHSYNDSVSAFATYASVSIRRQITHFQRKENKHNNVKSLDEEFSKENNSSLHALIADSSDEPEKVICNSESFIETINIILNCLDKKEGYTIISRYLLKMSQKSVASKMGCSQRYISTLEKRGLKNLETIFSQNQPYDKSFCMEKVGSHYVLRIQLDEKDHYWQKIEKIIPCTRNETEIIIRAKFLDEQFFKRLGKIKLLKS